MADWESTRQQCLADLKNIGGVLQATLNVQGNVPQIPLSVKENLDKIQKYASQQFNRLNKNEFEVAVIGTEKAGKSTLLNGWLGFDILPNATSRCTYTTTEIRSALSSEQRIEVEYYTIEEFNQTKENVVASLKDLDNQKNKSHDYDLLEGELTEIQQFYSEISRYLSQPTQKISFTDFSEVKSELNDLIANPRRARAVKKVAIYTPKLFNTDKDQKIVFYDVPGFDSPITLHKEQAEKKLGEVDAILYSKDFGRPSLTFPEVSVLKHNDAVDVHIKIGQKCFVALTQFDRTKGKSNYDRILNEAYDAWDKQTDKLIPRHRIIPVCAPLEIQDWNETQEVKDAVKNAVDEFRNGNNGMQELKDEIKKYIDTSRAQIVRLRCDRIVEDIKQIAREVLNKSLEHYGDDVQKIENEAQHFADTRFSEWWPSQWERILDEFLRYDNEEIRPKDNPDSTAEEHHKADSFRQQYEAVIDKIMQGIPITTEKTQEKTYIRKSEEGGIISPTRGHNAIREKLADDTLNKFNELAEELARIIWNIVLDMIAHASKLMWNISGIRQVLYGELTSDEDAIEQLKLRLEALIIRLGRPAVSLFLEYPRDDRQIVLQKYSTELMVLDIFYKTNSNSNDIIQIKGLPSYLANGEFKVINTIQQYKNELLNLKYSDKLNKLDEIKKQVAEDIKQFIDYMKNSIYYASGIEAYSNQELDSFIKKFREAERKLENLVKKEVRNGRISEAPNIFSEVEKQKIVAKCLQELKSSLNGSN